MTTRIESRPGICGGKPVVAGTRITVAQILGALAGGDSIATILEDYPTLKRDDILAALQAASDVMQFESRSYDEVA